MGSPFPGMDPYLESPEHWSGFHHHLAEEIMTALNRALGPNYFAEVEVRTVLGEIDIATAPPIRPDVAVLEQGPRSTAGGVAVAELAAPIRRPVVRREPVKLRSVRVVTVGTRRLVTTIELLSPVNKRGRGLRQYQQKRERILTHDVHLIEIDLLRGGERPGREVAEPPIDSDYILLVNRFDESGERLSDIWPVALDAPLPTLPVPLLPPDPDVTLPMGSVLQRIYERAAYARRIDYSHPIPPPPLRQAMAAWHTARQPTPGE